MRNQIKKVMPQTFYKIKKDPIYQEVKAEGIEQGVEKTLRISIERLILKKILTEMEIADALEVSISLVDSIRKALIKEGRLDA